MINVYHTIFDPFNHQKKSIMHDEDNLIFSEKERF